MSRERASQGSASGATPLAAVRPIAPGDVTRVWELLRGLAEYEKLAEIVTGDADQLREALFGTGDRLRGLVAELAGRLVGYALYYPAFASFRARWRLWLEDVYVEPEARGSGAGVALMAELARLTLDGGYLALDWELDARIGIAQGPAARCDGVPIDEPRARRCVANVHHRRSDEERERKFP
jgi:GNAT superfamily N-acetyltransferase